MKSAFISIFPHLVFALAAGFILQAQENTNQSKFRQLDTEFATPNNYRTASGAPGHQYWQQRADYKIQVAINDDKQTLTGKETITYSNFSPDRLNYLWLQLDQNYRSRDSDSYKIEKGKMGEGMSFEELKRKTLDYDGGFKITAVTDQTGKTLPFTIVKTMMRIDLPVALEPAGKVILNISWWYNINNRSEIGGRSGYEFFKEDGNYLYTIAQFYPRLAMYNDLEGWQHKQFLGRGEFTLCFGDFEVDITVPSGHIVGATGVLQNEKEMLTVAQRERLAKARTAASPVFVVNEADARESEKSRSSSAKTWKFRAENVRDFAFASSRKFIWDAMNQELGSRSILCMSFYPKEGNPLWEQYSTKAVAHTLRVYSKYTFDYPYPIAISVHTDRIGMEYPMISFNGGRPEADGTYSERTKYGMISVIIHEVGHNYFPMIVNSDERQWTWMDEGLNTYLQFLAEKEWDRDYPSRRGPPSMIVDYMKGDKADMNPAMTTSDEILQFGNNAYGKPATALNILRETVLGRELFDFAFREYSKRWMFKHPTPEDFFRTIEDASGVDLDWFWRGWFYTTDHSDQSIEGVRWFQVDSRNPEIEKALARKIQETKPEYIGDARNDSVIAQSLIEKDPALLDFYNRFDEYSVSAYDRTEFDKLRQKLDEKEKELLNTSLNFYEVRIANKGGLIMPVIIEFEYTDSTKDYERLPAEIWINNESEIFKVFLKQKEVRAIRLDPFLEIADVERSNNSWPREVIPSRFQLFREKNFPEENQMQLQLKPEKDRKEND